MIFQNKLFKVIILRGKPWNLQMSSNSNIHIISSSDSASKSWLVSVMYLMKWYMIAKASFVVSCFWKPEQYIHSLDMYRAVIFYDTESVFTLSCLEKEECHITIPLKKWQKQ